jgi:pterin-4a-carbinolamine dehydratase
MSQPAKLDWHMRVLKKRIIVDVSFLDFEQSMRFLELVTGFIQTEAGHEPESQGHLPEQRTGSVDG